MATKKRKRFDEGGITEAADKAAGLKASEGDKVGFFERLRMGNIDQEGSEAYNRFGAGRGKAERNKANQSTAGEVSPNVYRVDSGPGALNVEDEDKPSTNVYRVDSGPGKMSSGASKPAPIRKPAASVSQPTKGSSPYRVDSGPGKLNMDADKSYTRRMGATAEELAKPYTRKMGATEDEIANYKPAAKNPNYSNEGRGRQLSLEQQYARAEAEARSPEGRAKRKQQEESQGLERVTPETALLPGGSLKSLNTAAKALANRGAATGATKTAAQKAWERSQMAERLAPTRSAAGKTSEQIAREKKTMNPLAWLAGPKGMADDFKRGGKVKAKAPMKKMASGGSTSKASSRADGIAQRGKTRGKIY